MDITKEEQIKLVMAKDWWETEDLNGKLNRIKVSDGPLGLRCLAVTDSWQNDSIYPAVAYPCYQMLAQTWDLSFAWQMGRAIADDCIVHNVDVLLGPGVNIKRTPLCGRNFEYFSEDPYVAGVFGKAFIEGVQSGHVGTSLKHYCCNNREYARYWLSSEVDEQTLYEIYLKPFFIATQARPWMVMTSYNLVNGVRMSANRELNQVLREEMGFDGVIVSDWEAVQDPLKSLHAGLDLEFPYNPVHAEQMYCHLQAGEVDEKCLAASSGRIISLSQKVEKERMLQSVHWSEEDRITISQKIEEDGIVLLKNNGILPLKAGRIMVTGAPAYMYYYGGGSSAVIPNRPFVSLVDALKKYDGMDAFYSESIGKVYGSCVSMGNITKACCDGAQSDVTVLTVGTGAGAEVEETDRQNITLTPEEMDALRYLRKCSKKLVVVVYAGSAVDLTEVDQLADAVVLAGFGGQNVSQAVAAILTGATIPSGRLTETYAKNIKDIPAENTQRDEAYIFYEERLSVGYRYFAGAQVPVLYPFGYGLSYTSFAYYDLKCTAVDNGFEITVGIKNTGCYAGKEVVQLYVGTAERTEDRPLRELRAFCKEMLEIGEEKKVHFHLPLESFAQYSVAEHRWIIPNGRYYIQICKNAHSVLLEETICI